MRLHHGEAQQKVYDWLKLQQPGLEIHYKQIAEELELKPVTVSGIMTRMTRMDPPLLNRSPYSGLYRVPAGNPAASQATDADEVIDMPKLRQLLEESPIFEEPYTDSAYAIGSKIEIVGVRQDGKLLLRGPDNRMWEAEGI